VNSLPKTVTRQRRDCDLNPGRTLWITVEYIGKCYTILRYLTKSEESNKIQHHIVNVHVQLFCVGRFSDLAQPQAYMAAFYPQWQ